jgi:transcriptional regulator with XRE-family HTH domain
MVTLRAPTQIGTMRTVKLRKYRNAKGITLTAMAKLIGVSDATVSRYEHGRRTPRYETMQHIKQITNGDVGFDDWHRERQ